MRRATTARIYEVARIPDGDKVGNFHIPLTVDGYRAIYRGYLADPDLQDARARWPFVAMWDNHEFSWQGWQSIQKAGGRACPGQSIKVAANQAWFEYLPARVAPPGGSLEASIAPQVKDVPIKRVRRRRPGHRAEQPRRDQQPHRLPRAPLRPHLDLIITDQHSYRSAIRSATRRSTKLRRARSSWTCSPRRWRGSWTAAAPSTAASRPRRSASTARAFPTRKDAPPQTILGASRRPGSRTS